MPSLKYPLLRKKLTQRQLPSDYGIGRTHPQLERAAFAAEMAADAAKEVGAKTGR
jgi:hypothetical protein